MITSFKDRLASIEHVLHAHGTFHAEQALLTLEKEAPDDSAEYFDLILNTRIQIFIQQSRFKELRTLIEGKTGRHLSTKVRILLAQGILANRSNDFRKSLMYFLEAESLANSIDNLQLKASVQINIGTVYARLHHYDEGRLRYNDVIQNCNKVLTDGTLSILLHNLGNLYYANGNLKRSIECLNESIAISNKSQNEQLRRQSEVLLCRSQLANGQEISTDHLALESTEATELVMLYCKVLGNPHSEPKDWLEVIDAASTRNDYKVHMDALQGLIECYKTHGDFKSAFQALQQYREVEQALLDIQQTARLTEQEVRFEIAEKEQTIKALEKENALKEKIVKKNEQLEVANEDLRQFAYVVSHDLKEPLRMIGSYTQLIEHAMKGTLSSEDQEYFSYVQGGVQRLNLLLDGLSHYSTLKSLFEHRERKELSAIIKVVSENLDVSIKESDSSIEVQSDISIFGSASLLVLLFQNLIQNAIKFRRPDHRPVIKIIGVRKGGTTVIDVKDNGVGIAANQKERVFVIFQRLQRDKSGSGMGLAICKKIVQLHDGRLSITKSNEAGTTFRIELPD